MTKLATSSNYLLPNVARARIKLCMVNISLCSCFKNLSNLIQINFHSIAFLPSQKPSLSPFLYSSSFLFFFITSGERAIVKTRSLPEAHVRYCPNCIKQVMVNLNYTILLLLSLYSSWSEHTCLISSRKYLTG